MKNLLDPLEFLKADILSWLNDYGGGWTAGGIAESIGYDEEDKAEMKEFNKALRALLREGKISKNDQNEYDLVDEAEVKKLKKSLPEVF